MRGGLHFFAILSVLTSVWNLGPDRAGGTYLHAFSQFLRVVPRANECFHVHVWSDC